MKKAILLFLFALAIKPAVGQDSSATDILQVDYRTANGFALMPFEANCVNGFGFSWSLGNIDFDYGTMENEIPYLKVNGLHTYTSPLQPLAAAFIVFHLPFAIFQDGIITKDTSLNKIPYYGYQDGEINGASIAFWETGERMAMNGFQISLLYHNFEILKGLSISFLSAKYLEANGVMITGISNYIENGSGLQVALLNHAENFKGVQFGLWNKIGKRGLPLINIGF